MSINTKTQKFARKAIKNKKHVFNKNSTTQNHFSRAEHHCTKFGSIYKRAENVKLEADIQFRVAKE